MDKKLSDFILSTLSYYEAMTIAQIILDFDMEKLKEFPNFDRDILLDILSDLEKKKLLKSTGNNQDKTWIKIMPKKSWWRRLTSL